MIPLFLHFLTPGDGDEFTTRMMLLPAIRIENLLPMPMLFQLVNTSVLESGTEVLIFNFRCRALLVWTSLLASSLPLRFETKTYFSWVFLPLVSLFVLCLAWAYNEFLCVRVCS